MALRDWIESARSLSKLGRPSKQPKRDTQVVILDNTVGTRYAQTPVRKKHIRSLRALSENPVVRHAINSVKNPIVHMDWSIRPTNTHGETSEITRQRIATLTRSLKRPNRSESLRSLIEAVLEDGLVVGAMAVEMQRGGDPARPVYLWSVDAGTISVQTDPKGGIKHYVQELGRFNVKKDIAIEQLIYIRPNPTTYSAFGRGPVEFVFDTVSDFFNAYDHANRIASDSVPHALIDLGEGATESDVEQFRIYWRAMIEGKARSPVVGGKALDIKKLYAGDDSDLRLKWLEFLIKIVCMGFDLSPMKFGLGEQVNRSTAQQQAETDDLSAIKPWASLIAEHINHHVIGELLGWDDVAFCWEDLEKEDEERQARIDKMRLDSDTLIPDEVRARDGLPPLASGYGSLTKTERMILLAQSRGTQVVTTSPQPKPQAKPVSEDVVDRLEEEEDE